MTTRRQQIVDALIDALAGLPGLTVERWRATPVDRAAGTVVVVRRAAEDAGRRFNDQQERVLTLAVDVIVRGDTPDALADAALEQIHAAIGAAGTLGGLVLRLEEGGTAWDNESADADACVATALWRAVYRSTHTTLT